ncbi:MAG: polysaccharide biosynthesis C-terminal domain-containing protein [Kiritimatiellae bacterium]|nr:polysaccharide biosynthesis C-terminal domain-containing protein [Kiritimatiellia bacterium]
MGRSAPAWSTSAGWSHSLAVLWGSFGFVALRFLLTPVRIKLLTNLLARQVYGSLMLISTTVAFGALALSFGAFEFVLRRLPGRPRAEQGELLVSVLSGLAAIGAVVVPVGTWALMRWPPRKLSPEIAASALAPPLLVAALLLLLGCVFALLATRRYGAARWLQILASDLWFLPVALLAAAGRAGPREVMWAWVLWVWAATGAALVLCAPLVLRTGARVSAERLREWLAFGLPLMPMVLGDWLFRLVDQYVLLAVRDAHTLAAYALAVNIAMVGYFAGTAALDLLIAEFHRRRNIAPDPAAPPSAELREVVAAMVRTALVIGIATAAVLLGAGDALVRVLSSAAYDDAAALLQWTALMPLAFMLVLIAARLQAALGRSRWVGVWTLAAAALAFGLNLALTPRWGGAGAAAATTLALVVLAAVLGGPLCAHGWLDPVALRPGRVGAAALVSAVALATWQLARIATGPAVQLLVAATIAAGAPLATGALRRADLALLAGAPENRGHE